MIVGAARELHTHTERKSVPCRVSGPLATYTCLLVKGLTTGLSTHFELQTPVQYLIRSDKYLFRIYYLSSDARRQVCDGEKKVAVPALTRQTRMVLAQNEPRDPFRHCQTSSCANASAQLT